jgi:FkbM family methyltransferase
MFGAGHRGQLLRKYFEAVGVSVLAYIDNNVEMHGHTIDEREVLPLQNAVEKYGQCPIFIASSHIREIGFQLQRNGIKNYYALPYTSFFFDPIFFKKYANEINNAYNLLEDDESREIYASVIKTYTTGDEGHLVHSTYAQYNHSNVKALTGDVIIDGGAYTGDTLRFYHKNISPKLVLCVEPAEDAYIKLKKTCEDFPSSSLCEKSGLWSKACTLRLAKNKLSPAGNRIAEHGTSEIKCISIDELIEEHILKKIDMIKLDVEGSEKEAIIGASRSILTYKPRLQISIYHRIEDIFEIPLMIHTMRPDYRFYIGHHSPDVHETILYCA